MKKHSHNHIETYNGLAGLGLDRETDENTIIYYLQKFSDDTLIKELVKRLTTKEIEEIFFEERLKNHNAKIHISTDDGSRGYKGYASDLSKQILNKKRERFNSIITCGPEPMMKKLLETCGDIPLQASLERYMKCCIGLCGQCCIGEGLRVCVEGPVFDGKTLKNIEDFGVYRRDPTGRKIRILG